MGHPPKYRATTSRRGSQRRAGAYVALLRGVNVGGKHRLPMKDLADIFRGAGCADVVTYIQSGNVAFRATPAEVRRLPEQVRAALSERFGFDAPVVVRSAEAFATGAARHLLDADGVEPKTLHVGFLARRASARHAKKLDPDRSPPDRFVLRGAEIYLHCPRGMARTRLTSAYLDAALETTVTVRNWRTVQELARRLR